jgi:hypothetical protein
MPLGSFRKHAESPPGHRRPVVADTTMRRGTMKRIIAATAAILILSIAGCSAAPEQLTLAESKSPAQLLRIEAVNRVPADVVADLRDETDASVACKGEDEDPEGLYRAWASVAEISLTTESAERVDTLVDELVATFLDNGWTDRSLGGAGVTYDRFIWSETSLALLRVSGKRLGIDPLAVTDEDASGMAIVIESRGPCVLTGGPESPEVTSLEGRE